MSVNINECINKLMKYGKDTELISRYDEVYTVNCLLELFNLDSYEEVEVEGEVVLEDVLSDMLDWAYENGLIPENTVTYRDLFDTKIMSKLTPPPSSVVMKFNEIYKNASPIHATSFYYRFSQDTDYIRRYRIAKDMQWKADTEYGELDITINLSKPEKDPKAIAAAKNAAQISYPKCQLCIENEGYAGRINHPARGNHRTIPLIIDGNKWAFQYSPYVYYNEHCIVFNQSHTPMKIDKSAFKKLFDFVKIFPHYFVGSNADLPIVGGSILAHEHFQGGNYEFAMAKAPIEETFTIDGFEDVECGIVKWPMSVIRTRCKDSKKLVELGDKILTAWRAYTDEDAFIFANTDGEDHNTITPIARKKGDMFELDLVLRNNITTNEHPLGVYHPHSELHHIKKENIGLIEVMGLAVLPSRLKGEMAELSKAILESRDFKDDEVLGKHYDWYMKFKDKYDINKENVNEILEKEIGIVFAKVLEHAGVYKRTPEGKNAFLKFINSL